MTEAELDQLQRERIPIIRAAILSAIASGKTGRDDVNETYLSGLTAGLFFYELFESGERGSGQKFMDECTRIAKMLGLSVDRPGQSSNWTLINVE